MIGREIAKGALIYQQINQKLLKIFLESNSWWPYPVNFKWLAKSTHLPKKKQILRKDYYRSTKKERFTNIGATHFSITKTHWDKENIKTNYATSYIPYHYITVCHTFSNDKIYLKILRERFVDEKNPMTPFVRFFHCN